MKLGPLRLWPRRSAPQETPDPSDPDVTRVLMVCSGNICRSPTAEAVMRAKLHQAGLGRKVLVDSAGTHGFHVSEPPDPRAIQHAAKRGYDLRALRARPVDDVDFDDFDWILAMDQSHLNWLRERAPKECPAQIELFLPAGGLSGETDVPDPYYGAAAGFERVLDLVERACEGLVQRLDADRR